MKQIITCALIFSFTLLPSALGGRDGNFWPSGGDMPQELILAKRKELRRETDVSNCLQRLRSLENKLLEQTPWGSMDMEERVEIVYRLATDVLAEIKAASGDKFAWVSGNRVSWDSHMDGHLFHRDVGPQLASCIVYQETRGWVHPLVTNYTYCYEEMISSAHGLGQVVLTTLRGMLDHRYGRNFFPLVTSSGEAIKRLMSDEFGERIPYGSDEFKRASRSVHLASSARPALQMEMIFRILNEKAKFLEASEMHQYSLAGLIHLYDQDMASEYVKNVMQCHECMMAGGTPFACYSENRNNTK